MNTSLLPCPAEKSVIDNLAIDFDLARMHEHRTYRARAALMCVHLADATAELETLAERHARGEWEASS